jgi:hypothetical protein
MDGFSTVLGTDKVSFISRHFSTFSLTDVLVETRQAKPPSLAWVSVQCVPSMISLSSGNVEDIKK